MLNSLKKGSLENCRALAGELRESSLSKALARLKCPAKLHEKIE